MKVFLTLLTVAIFGVVGWLLYKMFAGKSASTNMPTVAPNVPSPSACEALVTGGAAIAGGAAGAKYAGPKGSGVGMQGGAVVGGYVASPVCDMVTQIPKAVTTAVKTFANTTTSTASKATGAITRYSAPPVKAVTNTVKSCFGFC